MILKTRSTNKTYFAKNKEGLFLNDNLIPFFLFFEQKLRKRERNCNKRICKGSAEPSVSPTFDRNCI